MRTTVDVDRDILREAMRLANARTQKEAIAIALQEFVRQKRLERLVAKLGTFELALTPEELDRMRQDDD